MSKIEETENNKLKLSNTENYKVESNKIGEYKSRYHIINKLLELNPATVFLITMLALALILIPVIFIYINIYEDNNEEKTPLHYYFNSNQSEHYFFINISVNFSDINEILLKNKFNYIGIGNGYLGNSSGGYNYIDISYESPLGNIFRFSCKTESETNNILYTINEINFSRSNLTLHTYTRNYDLSKIQEKVDNELYLEIIYFRFLFQNLSIHMNEQNKNTFYEIIPI